VIPRQYGYRNAEEYYVDISLTGRLEKISVPTLVVNANDDWCTLPGSTPVQEIEKIGSNILCLLTKRGAHCCHFQGILSASQFHPEPIVSFFSYIYKNQTQK